MKHGALQLTDYPGPLVQLTCHRYGRRGQYRIEMLLARFGPDKPLPDILAELARCRRWAVASHPCGAHFPDLGRR